MLFSSLTEDFVTSNTSAVGDICSQELISKYVPPSVRMVLSILYSFIPTCFPWVSSYSFFLISISFVFIKTLIHLTPHYSSLISLHSLSHMIKIPFGGLMLRLSWCITYQTWIWVLVAPLPTKLPAKETGKAMEAIPNTRIPFTQEENKDRIFAPWYLAYPDLVLGPHRVWINDWGIILSPSPPFPSFYIPPFLCFSNNKLILMY